MSPPTVAQMLQAALEDEIRARGLAFTGEPAIDLALHLGLNPIGPGRHRFVFRLGDEVVKVPLGEWGLASNDREARLSAQADPNGWLQGICYARCHMAGALLLMEYVEPVPTPAGLPDWTFCVDCFQVGIAKDGQIRAYDYGF